MRIAIGKVSHESNTFSKVKTTDEAFRFNYGDKIIERASGVRGYLGSMIDMANQRGVTLVPTFSTGTGPSGIITESAFIKIRNELVKQIKNAGPVDGLCLSLHGAGVAEGHHDIEGELLKAVREVVGYEIPIVVTLDLHGNLTETMVNEADALLGVNYYPHTDSFDRGQEAMDLLIKMINGQVNPVMSFVKLPLLVFPSTTYLSPAKDINEYCWGFEKQEGVLDCTFFHGFARADIAESGASVITIIDENKDLAQQISKDVANKIWGLREQFNWNHPSPEEGINLALETDLHPIVLNETCDNPGSGAPGDGTHLLKAMIEKDHPLSCFGFIYDPEVVNVAHQSGVGTTIDVLLGGKTDEMHGKPSQVKAYVKAITDGKFIRKSPMSQGANVNLGRSVRLQIGNVDVIVCSVRAQTLDEEIFVIHGIDITEYKLVALKSAQHFRAGFQPISEKIITVDAPGISTSNPSYYDYKNVKRPIYPLDVSCELTSVN